MAISQRYRVEGDTFCIDLRLRHAQQMFDARDPAPFLERDLDDDAVEYLMASAAEIPRGYPVKIVIQIEEDQESSIKSPAIVEAIHSFFRYRLDMSRIDLAQITRQGQGALVIGLCFLFACLALAHQVERTNWGFLSTVFQEGLTINGWVAMWRPIDMLLYSWWPIVIRRRVYRRLLNARVDVQFAEQKSTLAS